MSSESPLFQESESNIADLMEPDTLFSDYIRQCRELIKKNRVDLGGSNSESIVNANTPFERIPDPVKFPKNKNNKYSFGILLVHGLSNSPYETRGLADYFQSKGFLVRSILLPGHGTVPGDLLSIHYKDWIKACEYGIQSFTDQVEKLYIAGNSVGASLSLYMGMTDQRVDGLFLFAPSLGIKRSARFANTFIAPKWISRAGESDYARYESFCSNAAAQAFNMTKKIDRLWRNIAPFDTPVFIALSQTDMTVRSDKTISVFKRFMVSEKNRMILYTPRPRTFDDKRIVCTNSIIEEDRIIDYSHLSIIVPPGDPHYGHNGDYRLCYFYNDEKQLNECLTSPAVFQGEYTPEYLKLYTLKRLTYNPYFRNMTEAIDTFLKGLF